MQVDSFLSILPVLHFISLMVGFMELQSLIFTHCFIPMPQNEILTRFVQRAQEVSFMQYMNLKNNVYLEIWNAACGWRRIQD